ncbi:MAG: hypothetical protein COW03_09390 [Cytophagales bacterium CG12_big_fil_rev_8_21_14_0_65_40_12]|nr:MAG: hypothetical protein COW03_09390 [Cytophagales bacterium CG12_big_fil_rev_8_21_14_0_65_40_12]PIW05528.1 MAG: hypothetical protein COW40_03510 [Cytophagales bacterium CG17_big_fil_post_rev_8_21_14_2_50_40_13]
MKVVIINAHIEDSLGGSEMQCDLIAQGLTSKGHDVIYASVGKFRLASYPMVKYKVLPLNLDCKNEVALFLEHELPDIIYWRYNRKQLKHVVMAKELLRIPMVFAVSSVHDSMPISFKGYSKGYGLKGFMKQLARIYRSYLSLNLIKKVDGISVLNSQLLHKLPNKKQITIWNAATLEMEHFEWERPYVIWVANIKQIKRPEKYIELASRMAQSSLDLDFLMVGDIHESIPYEVMIQDAKKLPNFHFLGKQSPELVNGILKSAICLVHTCEPEGFGNNFIQAWLQGCPTITLDHDPDGLIQRNDLGFVSRTIEQMASDVLDIFLNKELQKFKGDKARNFAKQHFTPEALTIRVESFLKEVINSKVHN